MIPRLISPRIDHAVVAEDQASRRKDAQADSSSRTEMVSRISQDEFGLFFHPERDENTPSDRPPAR